MAKYITNSTSIEVSEDGDNISFDIVPTSIIASSLTGDEDNKAPSVAVVNDALVDTYSTSEVKTNKVWIDGKPIYRRTFTGTISSAGQWLTVPNSIINNYQRATAFTGIYGDYLPCPAFINNDYSIALQYNASYGVQIFANGYTSGDVNIIIEYTKTTD